MPHLGDRRLIVAALLLLGAATALLIGCDLPGSQPTALPGAPTDTPRPSEPTPVPTAVTPSAPPTLTLTIWTTEVLSPTQAITSSQILARQATDFEAAHPDVRLNFVLKKPYGKGGVLDYLLSTQAVVPDLLPDLAILDVNELGTAVQAGLVQPLDDLVPAGLVADLYPFAREACTFDGRLYGLQLWSDLDHLVYNTGKMTVPPSSWPGVLSNPRPYIFPAGGQSGLVNDAFLIQYLAVRPWPPELDGDEPFVDEDSLIAVLQFYQDGASRGIFPAEILTYHSTDDCWRAYLAGEAAMAQVSASRYLAERHRAQGSAVAPIQGIDGPAAAISRGWVLVLVTSDAFRQSPAVEFMTQWLAPDTNAAWSRAAGYLPTRQAALADRGPDDGYDYFTHQQLLLAQPRPRLENYTQVAAALQEAVANVLSGAATPEEAAAQVMSDLEQ